jgi:hypothetical protein
LDDWFVDTATFDHRRCFLFTNRVSLYSLWIQGIRRSDRSRLWDIFTKHLVATMERDGFDESESRMLCRAGFRFAKTNDRSTTSSMNDHIRCSRWYFDPDSGPKEDIGTINSRLNHTPIGGLGTGAGHGLPCGGSRQDCSPKGVA